MTTALWLEDAQDGETNMARDVALWEAARAGQLGLRVYGWTGPWVTLGRHQSRELALRPDCPLPSVVRPTGGKAVLHGHDWTVGLALPVPLETRGLRGLYPKVVAPLVLTLQECGLRAKMAGERSEDGPISADCFASAAPLDIVDSWTGQKLCGCAMKVSQGAVLLQASIPRSPTPPEWEGIFMGEAAPELEEELEWSDGTFPARMASIFVSWSEIWRATWDL